MMQYFTHEDLNPSERTLSLIRQIAYRPVEINGKMESYCLN